MRLRARLLTVVLAAASMAGGQEAGAQSARPEPDRDAVELWKERWPQLGPLINLPVSQRAEALRETSPWIQEIEALAREQGRSDFAHFIRSQHAALYKAYPEALAAIDRALEQRPDSARYVHAKANLTRGRGSWLRSDDLLLASLDLYERARDLFAKAPESSLNPGTFDFNIALALSELSDPPWEEVVRHYRRAIELSTDEQTTAFAWNNVSIAHRRLGRCAEAKEAAERARALSDFGNARRNERLAEFCLATRSLIGRDGRVPPEGPEEPRTPRSRAAGDD